MTEARSRPRQWTHLMLHHSASSPFLRVKDLDELHRARGWRCIGYHYVLERDEQGRGHLKAGRSDALSGAHAGVRWWNEHALGLCAVGYFHPGSPLSEHMGEELYQSVLAAVCHLVKTYHLDPARIVGHRQVKPTACPGDWFPLARLKGDVLRVFAR